MPHPRVPLLEELLELLPLLEELLELELAPLLDELVLDELLLDPLILDALVTLAELLLLDEMLLELEALVLAEVALLVLPPKEEPLLVPLETVELLALNELVVADEVPELLLEIDAVAPELLETEVALEVELAATVLAELAVAAVEDELEALLPPQPAAARSATMAHTGWIRRLVIWTPRIQASPPRVPP